MISHSLITLAWMISALGWKWLLGLKSTAWRMFVLGWTGFIIGVWYSREQYWEELKYRERGEGAPLEILPTLVYMFVPTQKNMDFILPAIIAVVLAAAFVLLSDRRRRSRGKAR
ncbi:MAG: hypothetical protein KBO59_28420 [Achromobacter sp.]|nr:hypothetical protein [Achromobacter sp.]